MVFNGTKEDQMPFNVGQFSVRHCDEYTYLGAIITSDGKAESALLAHVEEKRSHYNKLTININMSN